LAQTKVSCLWNALGVVENYQAAVSLHSHTNHSRESLAFISEFAQRWPVLHWALEHQCKRSRVPVDLTTAHWTPPLSPQLAFETESNQIESVLGLKALVALTDHDNIEARLLLMAEETREIPFSLEWTVPCGDAIFHLGIHNLPGDRAPEIVADLVAYSQDPSSGNLGDLIAMLDQHPEVLVIFNHPLWDLCSLGRKRYPQVLNQFLQENVRFLHAFEVNGMRTWNENDAVIKLAERWQRLIVSGGDRHGCEPSGALNLTRAHSFSEFVQEIRKEERSHVLFMPQYAESKCMRTIQTLLDVVREYPEYPLGSQRWDGRVFHPDHITNIDRPVSAYWDTPPAFLERIFSAIRLLENTAVRHVLTGVLRDEPGSQRSSDIAYETTL
jgi:hypothetical protein